MKKLLFVLVAIFLIALPIVTTFVAEAETVTTGCEQTDIVNNTENMEESYCINCGEKIGNVNYCPYCGTKMDTNMTISPNNTEKDGFSTECWVRIVFIILIFLFVISLFGLVLYIALVV